jgi:hypothetical protein
LKFGIIGNTDNLNSPAQQMGYKAGLSLFQNWIWVPQIYYTRGNRELKRAKSMIKEGNWCIAEKVLLKSLDPRIGGSEKQLGRVYYNLALVAEGQGRISKAIAYCEESAATYGNKLANSYLKTMRKRSNETHRMR